MSKLENARPWLEKAEHDLGSAKILYLHAPEYWDTIVFHCQQSSEKGLKALLVFWEMPFKRTHDLVYLLDLLAEKNPISDDFYEMAYALEAGGVEFRYPDHRVGLTNQEVREAVQAAERIFAFVLEKIGA